MIDLGQEHFLFRDEPGEICIRVPKFAGSLRDLRLELLGQEAQILLGFEAAGDVEIRQEMVKDPALAVIERACEKHRAERSPVLLVLEDLDMLVVALVHRRLVATDGVGIGPVAVHEVRILPGKLV